MAAAKLAAVAEAPTGTDDDDNFATMTLPGGRVIRLPVLKDAAGAEFVDIRQLQPSTGVCTFDPGFTSTAACQSSITYIDGEAGKLLYRGYPIEQLAGRGDFLDAAYALLYGNLPTKIQKRRFELEIKHHTLVHESLIQFYKGFKHDAPPMAIMVGVVGALSAFYDYSLSDREVDLACVRLIAKAPTLAALAYKTSRGLPFVYPKNELGYAENLLYMLNAVPTEPYKVSPVMANALEKVLITYLDHEQNASTSTVRTAGSSQANPFACVASGIAALWGPAHGGANEAVVRMLMRIGTKDRIPEFLARAKDKSDPFRLMGFGHRVYKTTDPRAQIMKAIVEEVLEETGTEDDPLLALAVELEAAALADPYFMAHRLYPNVEFYSGIVLRALGVPLEMFTVIFAVARTTGWIAQWKEMVHEAAHKISRPRQMYMGAPERPFVPVSRRAADGGSPRRGSLDAAPGGEEEEAMLEETAMYGDLPYQRTVSVKPMRAGM